MSAFIAAVGFGLVTAAVLAIASVGFTLQFGVTNVFNLAFGDTMTASAFIAYIVTQEGLGLWLAIVCGGLFGAGFSVLLNRVVYAPFIRRGTRLFGMIIVSIAVSLVMSNTMQAIWGANFFSLNIAPSPTVQWGPLVFTRIEIGMMGFSLVAMAIIHVLLRHTSLGRAMRATATNAALARNCGIATDRVIDAVWALSGLLCGLGGVALVLEVTSFSSNTGDEFIIPILAAAVLGGIGQPYGAMLGALVIGIATETSAVVISPQYKELVAFVILIVVLLLRPQGILSEIAVQKEVVV